MLNWGSSHNRYRNKLIAYKNPVCFRKRDFFIQKRTLNKTAFIQG